jgi:uncharacterized protein
MAKPTVAVIGASRDRSKFGNKSVRAHLAAGYDVYPVNPNESVVEGLTCVSSLADLPVRVDRVSMYVPPQVGAKLLDEIAAHQPGETWFNPGSSNEAVRQRARELGLSIIEGCSIVDLGLSPSQFP